MSTAVFRFIFPWLKGVAASVSRVSREHPFGNRCVFGVSGQNGLSGPWSYPLFALALLFSFSCRMAKIRILMPSTLMSSSTES